MKISKKFYLLILYVIFYLPKLCLASCNLKLKTPVDTVFGKFDCLDGFIEAILNWVTGLVSAACTLLIVYAGFKYITAAGNPEQIQKAKNIIIIAISSLLLVILGRVIIKAINPNL